MLGKLTKYEFKSVARMYLPLYVLVLLVAVVNRILSEFSPSGFSAPKSIAALAYMMLATGLAIITFIFGISRFKKNLLEDEGYLMFTLPVKRWELIIAKLISAVTWTIVGGIIGIISIMILSAISFLDLFHFLGNMGEFIGRIGAFNFTIYTIDTIVIGILSILAIYTPIYLALSLGHMSNKNKLIASFGWYFMINFAFQSVGTVILTILEKSNGFNEFVYTFFNQFPQNTHLALILTIVFLLIYNGICIFGTNYILHNKLNLE